MIDPSLAKIRFYFRSDRCVLLWLLIFLEDVTTGSGNGSERGDAKNQRGLQLHISEPIKVGSLRIDREGIFLVSEFVANCTVSSA